MFKVWRLMPDNTFKVVGSYASETSARARLQQLMEVHPDRRYGITWPENFIHRFTNAQSVTE